MLKFFGRGSAFSDTHNSAWFIHEDNLILLDCSMLAYNQIRNSKIEGINNIYILVTHTHADHIAGITMLIDYEFFIGHIPVIVVAANELVRDHLSYYITVLDGCEDNWYKLVLFDEIKKLMTCLVDKIPTTHSRTLSGRCFGYELIIDGKQVIYTGDTSTLDPFIGRLRTGASLYTEVSSVNADVHIYIDDVIDRLVDLSDEGIEVYLMHLDNEIAILNRIEGTNLKLAPLGGINDSISESDVLGEILDISSNLYGSFFEEFEDSHKRIFDTLTELGKTLGQCDRASFWKWDKRNEVLWTTSATGVEKITISDKTGLVGKAISTKQVVITNDPYNDPDFNSTVDKTTGYVTKSVMVLPVSDVNGNFIGAYQLINKKNDIGFVEDDVRKLSLAALICGLALESDIYRDDSHHDKLTGLKNRMGFYYDFSHDYSKFMKDSNESLSMFICDIDKFKSVNDTYGHNAGDDVLRFVAGILEEFCDSNQTVYRWGGEEFIMVLPDSQLKDSVDVAERIRLKVMNTTVEADGNLINCTISFGCHKYDSTKTIEDNISIADGHLYTAKESGRNRVVY